MSLNAYNAAAARHLPQAVVNPASMSQTVRMRQSICRELEGEKPENTQKTQQPKMDEYFQFCRELYPHQTFPWGSIPDLRVPIATPRRVGVDRALKRPIRSSNRRVIRLHRVDRQYVKERCVVRKRATYALIPSAAATVGIY